uniref:Trafficking protein particle complex II-specific subunit 120 homolog n=1 Tax=Kalanchoe fedtschenkoi TaxID=63787 RepID=A0A7N0USL5_KALFE
MEPDVSIETSSMIRVAVLPIGPVPHSLLRDYAAMLTRHSLIELASVTSFYTEHQKSPFAHQPWDSGSLQFRFLLGGSPPSPWEDFQSHRKILAVIGICHRVRLCSPDLDEVVDLFGSACRGYSSALATRCVAFCPGDSQLEDRQNRGDNLVLFPLADKQTQELHLLTMMQDLAASLLMEFEKWVLKAESSGTILKTPLDSQASLSSEEVIKARKRKLGRAQKTIGDYCLLAGSPVDAIAHYSTALELARLTGDFFWYAGALEGSVCALMLDRMGQIDPILEEEVKYRYNSVILHYRKSFIHDNAQRVSPLSFELEAMLKLARFLCRRELAKDVVDLLGTAADGAKSLIDASDRLILYVEIARLYGTLGYQRKAAFFSRQVAQLYMQQENRLAAISAMQILATTTKTYRVQSRASVSKPSNDIISSHADSGKTHHHSIVALFESQWSAIQMAVLREILLSAIRAGDPMAAWSAAARLLRSYYPLITPTGQNGLASALSNSAERLPSGIRCADPALPFIRLHSFPIHPLQVDLIKRLSFVKARLLSMEIPADVTKNLPKSVPSEGSNNEASCPGRIDSLIKIDPNRGSWGLSFLELELYNPTDVLFEISVSFELENSSKLEISSTEDGLSYPKTRIDRDHSSRVLIPLEHFKLPVLDSSFFLKDCVQGNGQPSGRSPHFSDKSTNRIKNLISRIKVRWRSGRNSSGDLEIQDAVNSALQTSVMDVMLPDPLTFGFRLSRNSSKEVNGDTHDVSPSSKSPLVAHDMTPMEVLVRNNTRETIKMSLSITCRDVAGENCIEGEKATVLWDGILNDVTMEVPSLQETMHRFTLYFLVPGEYTLAAAALIEDANEVLRARAKTASTDEPIFCCGPPFRVRVMGTS